MNLRRLAAGVLCVGFNGTSPDDAPLPELAELAPGAVVLFARNATSIEKTRLLVHALSEAIAAKSGVAPLVAVDQEGGRVQRLRRGAHDVPPMMALGAAGDEALAERVGGLLAADVRAAGANVLFAPVVDLAMDPGGTTIGERALGDDPARVANLGAALVRGIQARGVVATLKHFPGHGATGKDSHLTLPVVDVEIEVLRARDLTPFVAGIAAGARAVMSAHVVFRAFDAAQPATTSRRILGELLRGELGFTGACFTDCAEMKAVAGGGGTEAAAVLALRAGADCVVISHHLDLARRTCDAIVEAVEDGTLPLERLDEAVQRVGALRDFGPNVAQARQDAAVDVDVQAGIEAAHRAITLIRGSARLHGPATVISFEGATVEGAQTAKVEHPSLALALRERKVHAELLRVPLDPSDEMVRQLVALLRDQQGREVVFLSRRARAHESQRSALHTLLATAPDALFVAMREPFDVPEFPEARNVVCSFGDGEVSVAALADVLSGRQAAVGRLPVSLAM